MKALTLTYCGICDTIEKLLSRVKTAAKHLSNKRELNDLSDRQLKDIGLCRGDIPYVAKGGTVYRGGF